MTVDMKAEFKKIYGYNEGITEYFAPGRVNLIGEHTDYNGGFVFPCALDFGTYAAVRLREDHKIRFATLNFNKQLEISLDDVIYKEEDGWTNYPKGVIKEFQNKGYALKGLDILYYGNIPNGSGLSSSASLEVLTGVFLNDINKCQETMINIVKMSQSAENKFVGINCGIMDQFAVGMGRKDHAIMLDCNTLAYDYVPLKLDGVKIVIGNTKKIRGLADSKYNERRAECDRALEELQQVLDITYLCDLDIDRYEANKHLIKDDIRRNRAKHAVYENQRTKEAKEALEAGKIVRFGELMNQSHDSLKTLYEVTGVELDTMVEEARKIEGTIGSRMTGAGFGGCTVSLVREEAVDNFIKTVGDKYKQRTDLTPEFYVANIGTGAGVI